MNRDQRILQEVRKAKRDNPLGAARDAALEIVKQKYHISTEMLRAKCLHQTGCDYWN